MKELNISSSLSVSNEKIEQDEALFNGLVSFVKVLESKCI